MDYMKRIYSFFISLFFTLVLVSGFFSVSTALAAPWDSGGQLGAFGGSSGYDAGGGTRTIEEVIAIMVQYLLSFLGVFFVVLIIYGGFIWMLAKGDDAEVTKAKDIIRNAVIGLIIVLSAYVITTGIIGRLLQSTGTN